MRSSNFREEHHIDLLTQLASKDAVLVDVRDPSEFEEFHLSSSLNKPSSKFHIEQFDRLKNKKIVLICHTGARARALAKKLDLIGFNNVELAARHLNEIHPSFFVTANRRKSVKPRWSVDRQFRLALGICLTLFLLLFWYKVTWAYIIPIILASGLIVTSIIDRCYMRIGIGLLPWNK